MASEKDITRTGVVSTATGVDSDAPPPYEEPLVPPPAFSQIPRLSLFGDAGPSESTTVTEDQCVAHLKFLAVLADLRDSVSSQDGLFGILDSEAQKLSGGTQNEARAKLREKRWAVYTSRAVKRFSTWWDKCVPQSGRIPTTSTLETFEYKHVASRDHKSIWTRTTMPPIGEWNPCSLPNFMPYTLTCRPVIQTL